ncbi:MAG: TIGR00730 family Rossman fold protein [Acidimicrobiia bacterium]
MDLPRYRTGDAALDAQIAELIEEVAPDHSADLVFEMIVTALRLARDHANRGDMKIANTALKEMRYAFSIFSPYRAARKASIFGSARTRADDPLYDQARRLAARFAERGWMVVTGAGPGIMTAGIEGAGVDNAFGVSIRLPFEATTNDFLADDPKLVNFRYFFTRKLSFVKESDAFVLLPGGFGTLDEAFETLTLIQTGKAQPAPIILLDTPGGTYWKGWRDFVVAELLDRGYLAPTDLDLVMITDDVDAAVAEALGFYRNYHSMRFVGRDIVLRVQRAPDAQHLARLNTEFADIVESGEIHTSGPTPREERDGDELHLDRVTFRFDKYHWARLRRLIDALNGP